MTPTREQIGRILYECEKKRGQHADAVMKGISPKASDALLMEPWEECKDSFLSDADAVLSLFGSAAKQDMTEVQAVAAAILPVVDRIGAFTSEDRALEIAKLAVAALPRSAASTVEPVAWQWRVRIGDGWSQWIDGKGEPGVYRLEYARAIDAGRVETRDLYAAPTTSPEPDYPAEQAAKAYKQIVASPEPDWKQDQAETSRISRNHRGSQSNTCQQWGNEPCVTPRCDCPNRLAVSGKDGSAAS